MPRETKEQRLARIHQEALIEFDKIQSAVYDERLQCLNDRRFYSIAGAQWEGDWSAQFENKPKFEVNKIHLSVMRIINEYRNNRITVDFVSKPGMQDPNFADACDGLYRADEEYSEAEEAYDNAFEEAAGGGFGAWRLTTEYEDEEDEDNDEQRICIEPIFDADTSVFFDLAAKRQDKADAKCCFVLTSMTPEAFEEEYGRDPSSWDKSITDTDFDWVTTDVVYVAEYFKIETVRRTLEFYEDTLGEETKVAKDADDYDGVVERLLAIGAKKVRERKIKKQKVHKYILSGQQVEEDCGYIAGKYIPVIPVYGKRWYIDNIERCMGHVRLAKDAQRLKNMQLTTLGITAAYSGIEKPIMSPEQIAGHSEMWEEDNIKNYPYLLANMITDQEGNAIPGSQAPVAYTRSPQIPAALAALLAITEEDMKDLLGNQQNGEQITGNVSTDTVQFVQNRIDMQTYIYMSNMAKSMKRSGEVWLEMAKDIFVEEGRKMKTVDNQGEASEVELMRPVMDGSIQVYENDFGKAKFDVQVEVGPSSSTKRMATVRALTNMLMATDDPETKQVISAMILLNTEGEGIGEIRDYFRMKLLRMGVIKPTEEEAAQLAEEQANTPPSPEAQYYESAAANEQAKSVEAQSRIIKNQAETDHTKAETAKLLQDMDLDKIQAILQTIQEIGPMVAAPNVPGSEVQNQLPEQGGAQ